MRIISGEFKGRRLKSLPGDTTRPTSDKVKESLFNIIGPYFDGGICLDMYAGSGALAIESVSRGMDKAVLFEKDRRAQAVIMENIAITKQVDKFHLIKGDSQKQLERFTAKANLVFLDPPYRKQTIVEDIKRLVAHQLVHNEAIIVCETDKSVYLPEEIEGYQLVKRAEYATTAISIYEGALHE